MTAKLIVMREKGGKRYLFVLNFQAQDVGFTMRKKARLMYTGEETTNIVTDFHNIIYIASGIKLIYYNYIDNRSPQHGLRTI